MKTKFLTLCSLFVAFATMTAQETEQKPTFVGEATLVSVTPSLQSRMNELTPGFAKGEAQDGRSNPKKPKREVVPGKGVQPDYFSQNQHPLTGKIPGKAATAVWDAGYTGSNPTDPALAVGPDHVFVVWNTAFAIFDKDGGELLGDTDPFPAIFPSDGCCDLTVSYDNAADRWVISFLGNGVQMAISQTGNPLTTDWNIYNIPTVNDYNKVSVWSDGYYLTDQSNGNRLYAMDRAAMLAGNPTASIQGFVLPGIATFGFASPQALNVTDGNMPAAGNAPIVFFQDDAYAGVTVDHIKFWNANVDFANPGNSTISTPQEIEVTPFTSIFDGGSFANLTQPNPGGGTLDALQGIIMNQAQFRKFPTYNSAVFNHVIDTDPTAGKRAAVRWYEFRQAADGAPWTLYQEGTYESPDNKHAWNASLMMDGAGNIGMGYTGMSIAGQGTTNVSSYYTGRFASDPLNTMTISEEPIVIGDGVIVGSRYGDYSKIDIDPTDDATFYFTNEIHTVDTPNNQRAANVGRFKIAPDFDNDIGVVNIDTPEDGALTATEDVTVTIFNFGINDATGFPVTFQVDGGATITETFAGTIASSTSAQYTFTATADLSTEGQTYSITAATALVGDEGPNNDSFTKDVTHLFLNDVGVTELVSPVSASGLSNAEEVTITVTNFGSATQSNFPVNYTLNGGTSIIETFTGSLAQGESQDYTFTATVDLSGLGDYTIDACTGLPGDSVQPNDCLGEQTVSNFLCQPGADCTLGDGLRLVSIAEINNATGCETDGYGDFSTLVANLAQEGTYDITLTTGYGDQFVNVWVDFNDDFTFTNDELILSGFEIANGQATGTYTETTQVTIPAGAPLGMHRMRVKTNWNAPVPADACEETTFGETEDYTANVTDELGINDVFYDAQLIVTSADNENFNLEFNTTSYTNNLPVTVYNTLGQKLAYYVLENEGSGYKKTIDMSYVASGVYFFQVGDRELNKTVRVIVK
ncbi:MAG: GEVED domain-containing protein [Patiriisocius sp.]|uniref:GEVED domain-containing protein n=1 Tax=Patiriisocius sp. TaxID=2822396 RepID=UPI003EF62FA0